MLLLLDEHTYATENDLLRQGSSSEAGQFVKCLHQSGQSLIEHSYKADSDLSPAGWEYAERLKAAVMARRKAVREEKEKRLAPGETLGEENPLLVSASELCLQTLANFAGLDIYPQTGISHCMAVRTFRVQGRPEGYHERNQPVS